jgi:hypothetical protein
VYDIGRPGIKNGNPAEVQNFNAQFVVSSKGEPKMPKMRKKKRVSKTGKKLQAKSLPKVQSLRRGRFFPPDPV